MKCQFTGTPIAVTYSALHCTALHYTALQCTVLHWTVLHCTVLHCTALYYTDLQFAALFCTILHCTPLHGVCDKYYELCKQVQVYMNRNTSHKYKLEYVTNTDSCSGKCSPTGQLIARLRYWQYRVLGHVLIKTTLQCIVHLVRV